MMGVKTCLKINEAESLVLVKRERVYTIMMICTYEHRGWIEHEATECN